MSRSLDETALDVLFRTARTHNAWQKRPVERDLLVRLWDLVKMGPTSHNCGPARVIFLTSEEAKRKLEPALVEGNRKKSMAAPVVAVIGHDMEFHEQLPKLAPHSDARSRFVDNEPLRTTTAFRNGTLQGAYLMIAARALGLDCGPMSGFDNAMVDGLFFSGTSVKSNFICNLGYGNPVALHPRSPRLSFEEACQIL